MSLRPVDDDETRAQQREGLARHNRESIESSGIPFSLSADGQSALFREPGKRMVDFYFATGSWRCHQPKWQGRGGVEAFIRWYLDNA